MTGSNILVAERKYRCHFFQVEYKRKSTDEFDIGNHLWFSLLGLQKSVEGTDYLFKGENISCSENISSAIQLGVQFTFNGATKLGL